MNLEEHHSHTSTLISTVGRRLENHRRTILTKSNIKNAEYSVLVALSQQGRTQTELATEIRVFRTHIGLIVKELLKKEIVAIASPADVNRKKIYAITPAGYQLQQKLREEILAVDKQLFEDMTELEIFQVGGVLSRVQQRIINL